MVRTCWYFIKGIIDIQRTQFKLIILKLNKQNKIGNWLIDTASYTLRNYDQNDFTNKF